jgi:hypothetical protein
MLQDPNSNIHVSDKFTKDFNKFNIWDICYCPSYKIYSKIIFQLLFNLTDGGLTMEAAIKSSCVRTM